MPRQTLHPAIALLLLPFAPLVLPAQAQTAQPPSALTLRLQAIAQAHHGDVALFAENLRTHETAALSPDLPVQTASVIKLAILYEALEQIRAGRLHFEDRISIAHDDQVGGSGLLLFFDAPLNLTFRDVLTMMIVMSDNTAANLAMDHVGIAQVNARMLALGLPDTVLYKKVFKPVAPGTILPADQPRFGLGKTTPRQMASLMTKLATCDLGLPTLPADPTLCATAQTMLHRQFYRTSIPRFLDPLPGATGDSIANKTGSLDAVRNDIAAISTPAGLIVISAFTFNNKDRSWGSDHEGEATIARLAQAIVSAWSPQGLAPWPRPAAPR